MGHYRVVLKDAVDSSEAGRQALKTAMQDKLSLKPDYLDQLFAHLPVVVKSNIDEAVADKFVAALKNLGAIVEKESEAEEEEPKISQEQIDAAASMLSLVDDEEEEVEAAAETAAEETAQPETNLDDLVNELEGDLANFEAGNGGLGLELDDSSEGEEKAEEQLEGVEPTEELSDLMNELEGHLDELGVDTSSSDSETQEAATDSGDSLGLQLSGSDEGDTAEDNLESLLSDLTEATEVAPAEAADEAKAEEATEAPKTEAPAPDAPKSDDPFDLSNLTFEDEEPTKEEAPAAVPAETPDTPASESLDTASDEQPEEEEEEIDPSDAFSANAAKAPKNEEVVEEAAAPEETTEEESPVSEEAEETAPEAEVAPVVAATKRKKKTNPKLIWGLVAVVVAGAAFFMFIRKPEATRTVTVSTDSMKKMLEARRAKARKALEEKKRLESMPKETISYHLAEGKLEGMSFKIELESSSLKKEVTKAKIVLEQSDSPTLTPEQIVNGEQRNTWLKKFNIEMEAKNEAAEEKSSNPKETKEGEEKPEPEVSTAEESTLSDTGYVYMTDGDVFGRSSATITLKTTVAEDLSVTGTWTLANPAGEKLAPNTSKIVSGDKFALHYTGYFLATKVEPEPDAENTEEESE